MRRILMILLAALVFTAAAPVASAANRNAKHVKVHKRGKYKPLKMKHTKAKWGVKKRNR